MSERGRRPIGSAVGGSSSDDDNVLCDIDDLSMQIR